MFNRGSIILVGDDRSGVNSLKLSPNLRKLVEKSKIRITTTNCGRRGSTRRRRRKRRRRRMLEGKGPSKADLEIAKIDKLPFH